MPTIQIKSVQEFDKETKEAIKSDLGNAIELIPGKSETWLMVLFGQCQDLYFQGKLSEDAALVEVGIKGHASRSDFEELGRAITQTLVKHAGVNSAKTYISFSEYENYSWNGSLL